MITERVRSPERFVPLYFGVGLALNSALHAWYASVEYGGLRVGVPFLRLGVGVAPAFGYVSSLVLGIIAGFATRTWVAQLPPLNNLSFRDLFTLRVGGTSAVGVGGLLAASQLLAGSSWSKAVLDVVLVFFAALILVSAIRPLSLWTAFSLYGAVVSVLLTAGNRWLTFANDLSFPHFPAFAYFALASIYLLGSSFLYVAANNIEPLRRGNGTATKPLPAGSVDKPPSLTDIAHHRATIVRSTEDDEPTNADLLAYFVLAERAVHHNSVHLLRSRFDKSGRSADGEFFRARLDQRDREALLVSTGIVDADLRRKCRDIRHVRDELTTGRRPPDLERSVADAYDAVRQLSELACDE